MTRLLALAARWIAIAIAIAAVIDPELRVPRRERAVVRVTGDLDVVVSRVASALTRAGFVIDPAAADAVSVVVPGRLASVPVSEAPTGIADTTPAGPNVRVAQLTAGAARLPNQAVEIRVTLDAIGVKGKTTEVVVEDGGVPVASTRHA